MVRRVLLASVLLGACNLCHDRCADGIQPIEGTADDFRWDETRVAGVAVDGPRACGEADVDAHAIIVTLTGPTPVDSAQWIVDELHPALTDVPAGLGQSACDVDEVALIVHSWADADEVVGVARDLSLEQGVEVELFLSIEARPLLCGGECEA